MNKTQKKQISTWKQQQLWREGNPIRSLFRGVDFSRVLRRLFWRVNDHI